MKICESMANLLEENVPAKAFISTLRELVVNGVCVILSDRPINRKDQVMVPSSANMMPKEAYICSLT